jgi:phospholipid/cholesterol/gamma-HCH transport system substrate-binding protein
MKGVIRDNLGEALVGLLVVVLAVLFVGYAWRATGGGVQSGGTPLTALFPSAGGVAVGTDVRVAGLKVGSVTDLKLDPRTYQVAVRFTLNPGVSLPADSSAQVASEGLLGGTYVGLTPGGADAKLKAGDTITDTQGAMDLMALIGQFINKPASGGDAGGGNGTAAAGAGAGTKP